MFTTSIQITGKTGIADISVMKAVEKWEQEIAPALLAEIRRRAPVSQTTTGGRLRDSISLSRRYSGQGLEARITSTVPYAKFVQSGTSAHIIEPRNALALHWSSKGGDSFARIVLHPGTRPNPFVQQAISALMPMMRQKLREDVQGEFH